MKQESCPCIIPATVLESLSQEVMSKKGRKKERGFKTLRQRKRETCCGTFFYASTSGASSFFFFFIAFSLPSSLSSRYDFLDDREE